MCVGESEEGRQQQEATRQEGSRCRGRHPLEMVRLCCTTVCCCSVFFSDYYYYYYTNTSVFA